MGRDKYGDCIVARFGDRAILVDGGHPRDLRGQPGVPSIPEQLETIFGHAPPFRFTLVVVTHCHNDHIGCLPELIANRVIEPEFALVSDPSHGFPPGARDNLSSLGGLDALQADAVRRVAAGLAEEDHSDLTDAELAVFLDQVMRLGPRYRTMVAALEQRLGAKLIRWGVSPIEALQPLYDALRGTGFDIIAPSVPQLEACRDQIIAFETDAQTTLVDSLRRDARRDVASDIDLAVDLYRGRGAGLDAPGAIDRKGTGSALNCQSIMLKLGTGDAQVLLTGDMQFAAPEVDGIEREMAALLRQAQRHGRYRLLKLPHHTSYNGIDVAVWRALGKPEILVHSGGSEDASHPEPEMLAAFRGEDDELIFARTDRNGLISVDPSKPGVAAISISRGALDDFSRNRGRPRDARPTRPTPAPAAQPQRPATAASAVLTAAVEDTVEIIFVKAPWRDGRLRIDGHEIELSGTGAGGGPGARLEDPPPRTASAERLGGGRALPQLLFATDRVRLAANIGAGEAGAAVRLIEVDAEVVDLAGDRAAHDTLRRRLSSGDYAGVVLVGGYDVVPPERVDVLDPALRAAIAPAAIKRDQDEFFVWSDDVWGDRDGDGLPELPVSRVPDGRSAALVRRALTTPGGQTGAFGLRNALRPFAADVYRRIRDASGEPMQSAPTHYSDLIEEDLAKARLYFMLHGDDRDGSRFWGDDPATRQVVEAVNVASLPSDGLDVVFSGCCWGALTVLQRASRPVAPLAPKTPEQSMALASLMGGARAFVGCTGVHYSPDETGGFFGGPMHRAFWDALHRDGLDPAAALFQARRTFLAQMPHGRHGALELAIERKIYKQFTCLGLGW